MTWKECIKQLAETEQEKLISFNKADQALSLEVQATQGFFDKSFVDKHAKAYREWQEANNEYHGALSFVIKNKIDLDSESPCKAY